MAPPVFVVLLSKAGNGPDSFYTRKMKTENMFAVNFVCFIMVFAHFAVWVAHG